MNGRQTYSIDQIKDMLLTQPEAVIERFAPPVEGSYTDKGRYFTLNPGRVDRSVGSFFVWVSGSTPGKWRDFATGEHGDILDLIRLNLGCSLADAIKEARQILGLDNDTPEARRLRNKAAAEARQRRQEADRQRRAQAKKQRKRAQALWLSGKERIAGTPVEGYLRDVRGINLRQLGRQPRVLRYVRQCFYTHTDPETGEVIERDYPAMVAAVTNGKGETVACHRTYLATNQATGRWDKAPVPNAKKVLGDYAGGTIHLWSGTGPRGGKGGSLSKAAPGTRVFIAEGIEDALSCAMLLPDERVLAAISLSNFGQVELPDNVSAVTLIADQDENDQAKAALERAIAAHRDAGRSVSLWQNRHGGKDLNDALRQMQGQNDELRSVG
ncbi:MAG: toprim domain-containing protein [Pseudomonadota bacterium]